MSLDMISCPVNKIELSSTIASKNKVLFNAHISKLNRFFCCQIDSVNVNY